jgi:hypothetical protein
MSTSMAPKKLMLALWAGETWASTSASIALAAHLLDREPVILCGPGDYCVGDQGQAPGLFGLGFQMPGPEGSFMGVDEVALEGVDGFASVELARDLAPVVRISEVSAGVDGATHRAVLLERRRQRVLPPGRGQLADQQRRGRMPELQRPGQPQQVVVMLGDQIQIRPGSA